MGMGVTVLTAAGLVVLAVSAVALVVWRGRVADPVSLPPILPGSGAPAISARPATVIPEGLLQFEPRSTKPLDQEGFVWRRADGVSLPPLVSPCGGSLPSDGDVVAVRQVALVGPTLWKSERLAVYRDAESAARAMGERQEALGRCARHDEGDGTATVWAWQPLSIGEAAFFVTGQRFRDSDPVPGNYRGVLTRQGRAVVMYVDFGPRTALAQLADVPSHMADAQAMSAKLAQLSWEPDKSS